MRSTLDAPSTQDATDGAGGAEGTDGTVLATAETDESLELGTVITATGRLSIARKIQPEGPKVPFSASQLARLDEALALSTHSTGLEFAIYLGDLGENTRERAGHIHAGLGARAANSALVAVSPGQRQVEVVTGEEAHQRISDRRCQLAVMSMVASFKEGELTEGLISALRMLSDAAGARR